ncbi:MAG: metalloregulator ArsR/SmtB family transcription factor [Anaerolineae bacterium]
MDEITCCRYEDFVKALADETRQTILELLKDREMNVGEIVACFDLTQPTISYHLGLLRRAGVVLARREGQQVYYTANRCCLEACTCRLVGQLTGNRERVMRTVSEEEKPG